MGGIVKTIKKVVSGKWNLGDALQAAGTVGTLGIGGGLTPTILQGLGVAGGVAQGGGGLGGITIGGGNTKVNLGQLFSLYGQMAAGKSAEEQAALAKQFQTAALKNMNSATAIQQQSVDLQRDAMQPMLEMFRKFGAPGYETALKGLMSSYGYRPLSEGTSGTSLGQAPKAQTVGDSLGKVGKWLGLSSSNSNSSDGGEATPDWLAPGGTWGYFGDLGQRLGGITDKYAKARQAIQDQIVSGNVTPEIGNAAIQRIDLQEATENRQMQLTAAREGPMALLSALNPALNMGPASASAAQGIGQTASSMGNTAYMGGQIGTQIGAQATDYMKYIGQVMAALGAAQGTKSAPVPTVPTGQGTQPGNPFKIPTVTPPPYLWGGGNNSFYDYYTARPGGSWVIAQ